MLNEDFVTQLQGTAPLALTGTASELQSQRVLLVMHCKALASYLHGVNELTWAQWIDARVQEICLAQSQGLCNLLDGFTGLGNIGDMYLCPEAGHSLSPGDEVGINDHFLQLLSRINAQAIKVQCMSTPPVITRRL